MDIAGQVAAALGRLTGAERRAADAVLASPEQVAFGTVAEVAERAQVGPATVVRLAAKLGYDGYSGLQAAIRRDLAAQLRPTSERIRHPVPSELEDHLQLEVENVTRSLGSLEGGVAEELAALLAGATNLWLLSGDASRGVTDQIAGDLVVLRPGVHVMGGNPVEVARQIAELGEGDVVVTIDVRRYDGWVIDAARRIHERGVAMVAFADRVLSPIAAFAQRTVVIRAAGAGPFDSHVGTLAALNAVVAIVADRLRASAEPRIARIESAWRSTGVLVDDDELPQR